jgi:uncharacterized membrane protein required for colicin V production
VLFAIIGGMRGWAKELLVTFSVILALTLSTLLEHYVPFVRDVLKVDSPALYFWVRSLLLGLLVFFGYQTTHIARFAPKMTREKIQDVLLGVVLGALNGYLISGTIWFYLHDASYPFSLITPPDGNSPLGKTALAMLQYMPPRILGIPAIYFAVVLAFIFVIVVFI